MRRHRHGPSRGGRCSISTKEGGPPKVRSTGKVGTVNPTPTIVESKKLKIAKAKLTEELKKMNLTLEYPTKVV